MLQKRWFRALFRHRIYIAVLLVLQAALMLYMIFSTGRFAVWASSVLSLISLLVSLHIISRRDKGAYKLMWVFLILLFPVFGGLVYLMFRNQSSVRRFKKRMAQLQSETEAHYFSGEGICKQPEKAAPAYEAQLRYLHSYAHFPAYTHTQTQYYSPGEAWFSALLEDIKKAEHYVFLEYFIVQEGKMWNSILDVLFEKAKKGVEVRLIYDDMGCFFLLPKDYAAFLKKNGIRTCVFNPFRPFLSTVQNNRDHRKIAVIDGKVAYTGGINMADEYINEIEKYGHWKDAGVRIEGAAVRSFTVMFLQMWALCSGEKEEYNVYKGEYLCQESDGLVLPYADSPMDADNVCEHVYLQIINNAKRYVYIHTPYLILDDSLVSALCLAAKSGVDVKIVTPGKWDKRFVHFTTRSYYRELIAAGVEIYEYTNGFIHSKTFVSDDAVATIGTANMDFRSLYLHFECGVWMHKARAVRQLAADFDATLLQCKRITEKDCKANPLVRLLEDVFRLFAPLM